VSVPFNFILVIKSTSLKQKQYFRLEHNANNC